MDQHRVELYKLLQFDLYDYLNLVNSILCNRCNSRHPQQTELDLEKTWANQVAEKYKNFLGKSPEVLMDFGSNYFHVHHDFYLAKYIFSNKVTQEDVNNWFSDIEHGYFHGLMSGFIAYFFMKYVECPQEYKEFTTNKKVRCKIARREFFERKMDSFSKLFLSCIFHDFAKVVNGSDNHDAKLRDYFPNLLEEAYTHANPPVASEESLLVIADRTELRRYKDHKIWKKDCVHENKLTEDHKIYLDIFYEMARPALVYFFENRDELFLRHGLEYLFTEIYTEKELQYPAKYYSHLAKDFSGKEFSDNFAIEVDKFPFLFCANHSANAVWTYIQGFIKFDDDMKLGYWIRTEIENEHHVHFDHLVAKFDKIIKKWAFTHRLEIIMDAPPQINITFVPSDEDLLLLMKMKVRLILAKTLQLLNNNIFNFSKYLTIFARGINV